MVYSVLGNDDLVFAALDDQFQIIEYKELTEKLRNTKDFFWNRKNQPFSQGCIDLSEILNWFKIDNFEKIPELFDSKILQKFLREEERIRACLSSYNLIRISLKDYPITRMVPKHIAAEFTLRRNELLHELLFWLKQQDFYDESLISWFHEIKTSVINDLEGKITTNKGDFKKSFLFAENFRFKAARNAFNLFNLSKDERDIVIPEDNSFLFCADFKQFEFRTFLMLNSYLETNFETLNVYEEYAEILNLPLSQAKIECIAYLYGKQNETLEKRFPRSYLLSKIKNQKFSYREQQVIVRDHHEDGKKIHTIVQSISQYAILNKLDSILSLLKNKKSKFLYPHHDNFVFSIHEDEESLLPKIKNIMEDDVYKIRQYKGRNFKDIIEI